MTWTPVLTKIAISIVSSAVIATATAGISMYSRLSSLETGQTMVQHRIDGMDQKLDRILEQSGQIRARLKHPR